MFGFILRRSAPRSRGQSRDETGDAQVLPEEVGFLAVPGRASRSALVVGVVQALNDAVARTLAGSLDGPAGGGVRVVARERAVAVLVRSDGHGDAVEIVDRVLDPRLRDHLLALEDAAEEQPDDDEHDGDFDQRETSLFAGAGLRCAHGTLAGLALVVLAHQVLVHAGFDISRGVRSRERSRIGAGLKLRANRAGVRSAVVHLPVDRARDLLRQVPVILRGEISPVGEFGLRQQFHNLFVANALVDLLHQGEVLAQGAHETHAVRAFDLLREQSPVGAFQATQQLATAQICEAVAEIGGDILRQALVANPLNYFRMLNSFSRLTNGGLRCERQLLENLERTTKAKKSAGDGKPGGVSDTTFQEMEEKLRLM